MEWRRKHDTQEGQSELILRALSFAGKCKQEKTYKSTRVVFLRRHANRDNSTARFRIWLLWVDFQGNHREKFLFANLTSYLTRLIWSYITCRRRNLILCIWCGESYHQHIRKHICLWKSWRDWRRRISRQRRIGIAFWEGLIWMTSKETLYIYIRIGWITLIMSGSGTSDAPTGIFLRGRLLSLGTQ